MDTKKTKALLLALERGSLTAAAEELGYTQSGLTHMMNSLEDELGIRLLIRSKGGVKLSPAGEILLPRLRELTACAGELEREIEVLREQKKISLRLDPPAWRQLGIIVSQRRKNDKSIKLLIKCAQSKICPRQTG